jgi:hypothetical protein
MHIKEALNNIIDKKLDLMKENFQAALTEKAIEKLEERKIQIAETYFGQSNSTDSEK